MLTKEREDEIRQSVQWLLEYDREGIRVAGDKVNETRRIIELLAEVDRLRKVLVDVGDRLEAEHVWAQERE